MEPLGAASLAQVHRATLRRDGIQVAVKVQHPDVRTNGYTDMDTIDVRLKGTHGTNIVTGSLLQFLVACVHFFFPSFRFQWLADEVRRNLPIELDFRHEAKNQEKFSSLFKHLSFAKVNS